MFILLQSLKYENVFSWPSASFCSQNTHFTKDSVAQSAVAVEYIDCFSAER